MQQHKGVLNTWFQRVWNEGDPSAIDYLLKPEAQVTGLGAHTLVGPEDFKGFHAMMNALVSNFHLKINHSICEGDWVSALCTVTGKGAKNNKPIEITGNVYLRINDGIIVEGYNHFDFLGLYEQLGLVPDNTNGRCLSGECVG